MYIEEDRSGNSRPVQGMGLVGGSQSSFSLPSFGGRAPAARPAPPPARSGSITGPVSTAPRASNPFGNMFGGGGGGGIVGSVKRAAQEYARKAAAQAESTARGVLELEAANPAGFKAATQYVSNAAGIPTSKVMSPALAKSLASMVGPIKKKAVPSIGHGLISSFATPQLKLGTRIGQPSTSISPGLDAGSLANMLGQRSKQPLGPSLSLGPAAPAAAPPQFAPMPMERATYASTDEDYAKCLQEAIASGIPAAEAGTLCAAASAGEQDTEHTPEKEAGWKKHLPLIVGGVVVLGVVGMVMMKRGS